MTVVLDKVQTEVAWRSPDVGDKLVSIPGSALANKGYDLYISSTIPNGDTFIVTPTSGTIDGQPNFTFTLPLDENCTLSLRSDADNADWIIRCLCCAVSVPIVLHDAVFFDGFAGSYYTNALSGVAAGPLLSFSFWISAAQSTQSNTSIITLDSSGNFSGGVVWRFGDGDMQILLQENGTSAGVVNAHLVVPVDGNFHNVLGAIDAGVVPAVGWFYVDETIQEDFIVFDGRPNMQAGSAGFAVEDFPTAPGLTTHVGARSRGCLGDLWWAPGQFIDFSQSSNRANFHDVDTLAPVAASSLGASGETPTGTAPAVFLTGGKSTFGNNLGTGGALISTSVVENCLDGLHTTLPVPSTNKGGVRFNGTNLQFVYFVGENYTSVTLGSNSPTGLLSVWLRVSSLPVSTSLFAALNGNTRVIDISLNSTGRVQAIFTAFDTTTTATFSQTTGGLPADGAYHHLIFAWNTQAGTAQVAIDRGLETVTHSGSTGFDVGISLYVGHGSAFGTTWSALSQASSIVSTVGTSLTGDAAELWVSLYDTLDLSVTANIDKFNADGHPAGVGVDGSAPTGTAPFAYHSQQPQTYEAVTFYLDRAIPLGLDSTGYGVTAFSNATTVVATVAPAPYPSPTSDSPITGVSLNNTVFTGSVVAGDTLVGQLQVVPAFPATWTVGGPDAASFQVVTDSPLQSGPTLQTNGVVAGQESFSITVTATPTSGTSFSTDLTITVTPAPPLSGTVHDIAAPSSSAAIQAVIDGAAEGDTIRFGLGTFTITTQIRPKTNQLYISAAGGRATLQGPTGATTGGALFATGGAYGGSVANGVTFSGLAFQRVVLGADVGNGWTFTNCTFVEDNIDNPTIGAGAAVYAISTTNWLFEWCTFTNCLSALHLYYPDALTVRHCAFIDCFQPISLSPSASTSQGRNITVQYNYLTGMGRMGIEFHADSGVGYLLNTLVADNFLESWGSIAASGGDSIGLSIVPGAGSGLQILRNYIRPGVNLNTSPNGAGDIGHGYGIEFNSANPVTVSNNYINGLGVDPDFLFDAAIYGPYTNVAHVLANNNNYKNNDAYGTGGGTQIGVLGNAIVTGTTHTDLGRPSPPAAGASS
jgi:hypothetical protein